LLKYFKEDYEFLADALTEKGCIAATPDYRHYPDVIYQTIIAGPYEFIPFTEPYLSGIFAPESQAAYSLPVNFID
jgi:hypothetical protein